MDPYNEDRNYLRWMLESEYGQYLTLEDHGTSQFLIEPFRHIASPFYKRIMDLISAYFDLNKHDRLLDVGCGLGNLSFYCASLGHKVKGVDHAKAFVDFCIALHASNGCVSGEIPKLGISGRRVSGLVSGVTADLRLSFHVGDILELEDGSSSFDGIICSNVIDRVPNPKLAISEMRRVLKPGGRILCASPLDWQLAFTPNTQEWVESLSEFFTEADWKHIFCEETIPYDIRISDRFSEHYLCEVVVVEKR